MTDPVPLATAVQAALRAAHAECDRSSCALLAMWIEDVQEVIVTYRRIVEAATQAGPVEKHNRSPREAGFEL